MGARIKAVRTKKGISREALAALIGVRYNAATDWEKGMRPPKLESLLLLTHALALHSVEELLGGPFGTQALLDRRRQNGGQPHL